MKKTLTNKVLICLFMIIALILLLQVQTLAKSESIQMIEKSEKEYLIYVSGLLNEEFEFTFSNDSAIEKETLTFETSALDKAENGNHIAYIDSNLYEAYFEGKDETFLWVRKGTEYKLEAEKVELENAFSEEDIQILNQVTKIIEVEVGEKELPAEEIDGVTVNHKVGTLNIVNSEEGTYSYKVVKSTEGSDAEKLIELANEMNGLEQKNIFEQLSIYEEFEEVYNKLKPEVDSENWTEAVEGIIEQPQNSKKGEQYLVWIKQKTDTSSIIDVQIMTCQDEYTPEYETKDVVIKETSKMPITGDNITLFVIAGAIIILIAIVLVLKFRNNKKGKHM